MRFATGDRSRANAVVSVKGGRQLAPGMVRDLEGVVSKTKDAEMGLLITLHQATKGMRDAAATGGSYLNGQLIAEGHSVTASDLARALGMTVAHEDPPHEDFMWTAGQFPSRREDLQALQQQLPSSAAFNRPSRTEHGTERRTTRGRWLRERGS